MDVCCPLLPPQPPFQINAQHLLRYMAAAVVVNKRKRHVLKELIRCEAGTGWGVLRTRACAHSWPASGPVWSRQPMLSAAPASRLWHCMAGSLHPSRTSAWFPPHPAARTHYVHLTPH